MRPVTRLAMIAATTLARGGWYGMEIGYQSRGHHHVLVTTGWNEFVCGPSVPASYCGTT